VKQQKLFVVEHLPDFAKDQDYSQLGTELYCWVGASELLMWENSEHS
jgi:hypothetical protein